MKRFMNLRFGLPAAIFVVFLALSALSYYYNLQSGYDSTLEAALKDALQTSERLARTAQTELGRNKAQVESDLSVESTDWRITVLAIVQDDGLVQAAHRLGWNGRSIADALRDFDLQRLKTVTRGRLPDVQIDQTSPRRVRVLMPFVEAGTQAQIRSLASGAVYLEYDLSIEDAWSRWRAQRRWMVEAALAVLISSVLSWVLYRRVASPLLRIESASRLLSDSAGADIAVPVSGPLELRQLATAFNTMAEKVLRARREIESQSAKLSAVVGSAMDAIITVDGRQNITMMNEAAQELFGYTPEQAIGMPLSTFLPERFRASHALKVQAFGQEGNLHRHMGQRAVLSALRANG